MTRRMPDSSRQPIRRVLMTADTVGGVWTYALELAGGLATCGIETTVAAMGGRLSVAQRAAAAHANVEVCDSALKLEWMPDPWDDVAAAGEWLLALAEQRQPDVVHLNNYAHGALDWNRPTVMVGHSCVCSWHAAVRGCAAGPEWDRYRAMVARGLRAAGRVTAPTRPMLAALLRHYGRFRAADPIANGRARRRVQSAGADGAGAPPKEPLVLTAARLWDPGKNAALLARVAPELPWPVYAAGPDRGPDAAGQAEDLAGLRALGVLGQDELAAWYARAAIFCLPAWYEPFGLAPLEAAQAGCALVLGDIATLRAVWGDAAVYVRPDDPAGLRRALQRLIDDETERAALARRARRRAGRYSRRAMVNGYLGLYERVRREHGGGRRRSAPVSARAVVEGD